MALTGRAAGADFALKSNKMEDVKLSALRGNRYCFFLCRLHLPASAPRTVGMRDTLKDYEGLIASLGISTDSPFALDDGRANRVTSPAALRLQQGGRPLLRHALRRIDGLQGRVQRSACVIDREGKLRYAAGAAGRAEYSDFDEIKACSSRLPQLYGRGQRAAPLPSLHRAIMKRHGESEAARGKRAEEMPLTLNGLTVCRPHTKRCRPVRTQLLGDFAQP